MAAEIYKIIQDKLKNGKLKNMRIIAIISAVIMAFAVVLTACSNDKSAEAPHKDEPSSSRQVIAVVNQDIGVEYSGGTINYSEEFVKTLDSNAFELVSSASAEEGIKKGTYAGAIIFPSDLSASILNINYKNPQAIKIGYSVGENADKADSDAAYNRIADVYQKFNNKLSYAYINALMEEIELGQYNVNKIFNNDGSSLAAAKRLAAGNYSVDFKAPKMPEKIPEFAEQNTDEYRNRGRAYVDDVDRLFRAAYTAAHKNVTDEINTDIDTGAIDDSADKMKEVLNTIAKYIDDTAAFNDEYAAYVSAVENYQRKVDEYEAAVAKYQEKADVCVNTSNPTDEQRKAARAAKKAVQKKKDEVNAAGTAINGNSPAFPSEVTPPAKEAVEASGKAIEDAVTGYQNKLRSQAARLAPDEMIKAAMDEPGAAKTYKEKIDEARNSFMRDAGNTSGRFNKIQRENRLKLSEAYSLNSKFMLDTVKVLNETNTKDHKALDKSIESFVRTSEANSKDTRVRLDAFQSMLSSAKVGGRVSSDVMKFLIRPLKLVEKNTVN